MSQWHLLPQPQTVLSGKPTPSSAVDMLNAIQRARRLDRKSVDQELPGSVRPLQPKTLLPQSAPARARDLVDFVHLDEPFAFRSLKMLTLIGIAKLPTYYIIYGKY